MTQPEATTQNPSKVTGGKPTKPRKFGAHTLYRELIKFIGNRAKTINAGSSVSELMTALERAIVEDGAGEVFKHGE